MSITLIDDWAFAWKMQREQGESDESLRYRIQARQRGESNPVKDVLADYQGLIAEMRVLRSKKRKGKEKAPELHLWVKRSPRKGLKLIHVHNCTGTEIQAAIQRGAAMFDKIPETAERFQNLLFAELERRLSK